MAGEGQGEIVEVAGRAGHHQIAGNQTRGEDDPVLGGVVQLFDDQIGAVIGAEAVGVGTGAATERVVAGTTDQRIVAGAAGEVVIARPAVDQVVAGEAVDHVVARTDRPGHRLIFKLGAAPARGLEDHPVDAVGGVRRLLVQEDLASAVEHQDQIVEIGGRPQEAQDRRIDVVQDQHVAGRAVGVDDAVIAVAGSDDVGVVAIGAGQHVVAQTAGQDVGPGGAGQGIGTGGAAQKRHADRMIVHQRAVGEADQVQIAGADEIAHPHCFDPVDRDHQIGAVERETGIGGIDVGEGEFVGIAGGIARGVVDQIDAVAAGIDIDVVAATTGDPVVAEAAGDGFIVLAADQHVVAIGRDQTGADQLCRRPDGAVGKADLVDGVAGGTEEIVQDDPVAIAQLQIEIGNVGACGRLGAVEGVAVGIVAVDHRADRHGLGREAGPQIEHVVADAVVDPVDAVAAIHDIAVVAGPAGQAVVLFAAGQHVVAAAALDVVDTQPADQLLVEPGADHPVMAGGAEDKGGGSRRHGDGHLAGDVAIAAVRQAIGEAGGAGEPVGGPEADQPVGPHGDRAALCLTDAGDGELGAAGIGIVGEQGGRIDHQHVALFDRKRIGDRHRRGIGRAHGEIAIGEGDQVDVLEVDGDTGAGQRPAGARLGQGVVGDVAVDDQRIPAVAAIDRIGAGADLDHIVAVAALDDVVAGTAGQRVVTGAAVQRIAPGTADQQVGAVVAGEGIVMVAADQILDARERVTIRGRAGGQIHRDALGSGAPARRVDALAAFDHVGACAALDDVIAPPAPQPVVRGIADQQIIAVAGKEILDHGTVGDHHFPAVDHAAGRQIEGDVGGDDRGIDGVVTGIVSDHQPAVLARGNEIGELVGQHGQRVVGRRVAMDAELPVTQHAGVAGAGIGDGQCPGAGRQLAAELHAGEAEIEVVLRGADVGIVAGHLARPVDEGGDGAVGRGEGDDQIADMGMGQVDRERHMADLDLVGDLDGRGDAAVIGQRDVGGVLKRDRDLVGRGRLQGPGFGQPHGGAGVQIAEAGIVAEGEATAVPAGRAVEPPAGIRVGRHLAPGRVGENRLDIAPAQIGIRFQHQRDRARDDRSRRRGAAAQMIIRTELARIIAGGAGPVGRDDARARRADQDRGARAAEHALVALIVDRGDRDRVAGVDEEVVIGAAAFVTGITGGEDDVGAEPVAAVHGQLLHAGRGPAGGQEAERGREIAGEGPAVVQHVDVIARPRPVRIIGPGVDIAFEGQIAGQRGLVGDADHPFAVERAGCDRRDIGAMGIAARMGHGDIVVG